MFADIRRFVNLMIDNCYVLTNKYNDTVPFDLEKNEGTNTKPDYYNEPNVCLSSIVTDA